MNKKIPFLLVFLYLSLATAGQYKVIDMHIHAYEDAHFANPVKDYYGNKGSMNAEMHLQETFSAFSKNHIMKAVVSGSPKSVETWVARDKDNRVIRGIAMDRPDDFGMDSAKFEQMVKDKKVEVFGEIAPYYAGATLSDPAWQPYLSICERYDIPVAVHTGGGDPGGTYTWSPRARLKYGDPYLIEDVLVKYPKLRIYMMHAGEDWYEHALRLMAYYPHLYTDIAVLLWVEPLDQRYAVEFLKAAKQSGYLDRVMYGTDQMRWPYAIEKSIRFFNSLPFLTKQDKEDILFNNAARFLRLKSNR